MPIELIKLVFEKIQMVLARHDVFSLFGLFFGLRGHRCEVVIDHIEESGVLLPGGGVLGGLLAR